MSGINLVCSCGKPITRIRKSVTKDVLLYALSTQGETITTYAGHCNNGCNPVPIDLPLQANEAQLMQQGVEIINI